MRFRRKRAFPPGHRSPGRDTLAIRSIPEIDGFRPYLSAYPNTSPRLQPPPRLFKASHQPALPRAPFDQSLGRLGPKSYRCRTRPTSSSKRYLLRNRRLCFVENGPLPPATDAARGPWGLVDLSSDFVAFALLRSG